MKWFEQSDVLSHIIESYAGVDGNKRQFIWEDLSGDLLIGNSRAFSIHLSEKFGIRNTPTGWMGVHEALRAMGEIVSIHSAKTKHPGKKFKNQEPEARILRRRNT